MIKTMYLFFLLCTFHISFAQDDQVRVKVFDGSETSSDDPVEHEEKLHDQNYINFNPYLFARGAFVLGYERVLHPKHALIMSLGFTYKDFIYEIFQETELFSGSKSNTGYFVDLGYKWYPKNYHNFDGMYINPGILRRTYNLNTDVEYNTTLGSSTQTVDVGYAMGETYLKFGYVYESWWFDDAVVDVYCGFGYRNITSNNYTLINDNSSNNESILIYRKTKGIPAIYLGLRIGVPF